MVVRPSTFAAFVVAAFVQALGLAPLAAQEKQAEPQATFSEEQQVTAVDLMVGVERRKVQEWATGKVGAGSRLRLEELLATVAGHDVEVSAVERAADPGESRWRVVVYFDAVLCQRIGLRWAAGRLVERAEDLVSLGEVQIVVADPQPRTVLEATTDVERVSDVLGHLALFGVAPDTLLALREEFLVESEAAGDPGLAAEYVAEERRILLHRQDALLEYLVGLGQPAAGRALIYVSQGFDRRPAEFYGIEALGIEAFGIETLGTEAAIGFEAQTTDWVRAVASYGWVTVALLPEDKRPRLRGGWRLGKLRFDFPVVAYEGDRDPEVADAYVALGDAEAVGGDLEAARKSYQRALYHYYGDRRTKKEQAVAWLRLAGAFRGQGNSVRARLAVEDALLLDPSLADGVQAYLGHFLDPVAVLEALARETGGHLIRNGGSLGTALGELGLRQQVTYLLRGLPTGDLMPLELTLRDRDLALRYSSWGRSGTPERVSSARLRRFLEASRTEPDVGATRVGRYDDQSGLSTTIVLGNLGPVDRTRAMVGLFGSAGSMMLARLEAEMSGSGGAVVWRADLAPHVEIETAALYLEDVPSGEWTIETVSLLPLQ